MKKVLGVASGLAIMASGLLSTTAFAGVSANVSATSAYLFRGFDQAGGAAVQGGIDYEAESGLYLGTWASNINFGGGTEQDIYAGFATELGGVGVDVSAVYYWYPEEDQGSNDCSTLELGAGVSFGPVSINASYGDETNFIGCDGLGEAALYISAAASFPVSEALTLDVSVGQYSGDEIERQASTLNLSAGEDSYIDFMIGLSTETEDGTFAAFQYIATDVDKDDPKFVISIGKSFDL